MGRRGREIPPGSGQTGVFVDLRRKTAKIERWFSFRTVVRSAPTTGGSRSCAPPRGWSAPAASPPPACARLRSPPTCRRATCITTSAARTRSSTSARTDRSIGCSRRWPRRGAIAHGRCPIGCTTWRPRTCCACWTKSRGRPRTSRWMPCRRACARRSSPNVIATSAACAPSSPTESSAASCGPPTPPWRRARFSARSTGPRTGSGLKGRTRRTTSPCSSPTMPLQV